LNKVGYSKRVTVVRKEKKTKGDLTTMSDEDGRKEGQEPERRRKEGVWEGDP
jgi:hypothetical protein